VHKSCNDGNVKKRDPEITRMSLAIEWYRQWCEFFRTSKSENGWRRVKECISLLEDHEVSDFLHNASPPSWRE